MSTTDFIGVRSMHVDTQVAEQFGQAVAKGDFAAAHALLTKEAQQVHSAEAMQQEVANMTAYANAPIDHVEVMSDTVTDDWPGKRDGDVAWVYVALSGGTFSGGGLRSFDNYGRWHPNW